MQNELIEKGVLVSILIIDSSIWIRLDVTVHVLSEKTVYSLTAVHS